MNKHEVEEEFAMVGEKKRSVWKGIRLTAKNSALVKDADVKHYKEGLALVNKASFLSVILTRKSFKTI
jgi:hypothetical protein